MLNDVKMTIGLPIKDSIKQIKRKTYKQWPKKKLFKQMQFKHTELIEGIKNKNSIKVVFLAIHDSVWKVDSVFQKMLNDPCFEPEILVCPYILQGEERMLQDLEQAYNFFKGKGYPVKKSLNEDGSWLELAEIEPDVIFFTNPHKLTYEEYYENAYLNYLSCYVPYHHEVGCYGDNIDQYNLPFHNALWQIFCSSSSSYNVSKVTSASKAKNVKITGYPDMEYLLQHSNLSKDRDPWKSNDGKKRVIWAPHHTIDSPELPYSNFLKYAEQFRQLAISKQNEVVWAFKPHPLLREKLYLHPDWGKLRTDNYYDFWEKEPFSQFENSEYLDLFLFSDFMIHDSGSFLAEYLYLQKPVLYLTAEKNYLKFYSEFGRNALKACITGDNFECVERFISRAIDGSLELKKEHKLFFENEILPFFSNRQPSDVILKHIKEGIYGL